ncbi:hypothetical protein U2063_15355, partial [Listeria monocytogenes]|uniref:hypothetical protein n=1 Tax=Listeria monocytogenes TaxID=1639 RepID=UPI002FDC065D
FGVFWEPNFSRLAFFANLKKVVEAGKKDYSNESGKNQVLFYEMHNEKNCFTVKHIGSVPSERIKSFQWAGSDGVFSIFEQEG